MFEFLGSRGTQWDRSLGTSFRRSGKIEQGLGFSGVREKVVRVDIGKISVAYKSNP